MRSTIPVLLAAALCCGFGPGNDGPGDSGRVNRGEHVLTSVKAGPGVPNWQLTSRDVKFESAASWSVKRYTLHGGKQEGSQLIVLDNGKMQITVIPTRGMDLLEVKSGDVRLGWDSPVKEVVHPMFMRLESRGGLGWLEGFNEAMVRCGLEWAGHPGQDEFINNVGQKATMNLTLHGKIGNTPASEVSVVVDPKAPHRIRIKGTVYERSFYGPKLKLATEISTVPGSTTYRIDDRLTNQGAFDQEYQIIYHCNYGVPLLGKGSRVLTAAKRIAPFNAHAAEGIKNWSVYDGPTKGFIEQVYCLEPIADRDGRGIVMLENAAADRAVTLRWKTDRLPYLTVWKNTAAKETGYVTGLEPATGYAYTRRIEREGGRVPKIAPARNADLSTRRGHPRGPAARGHRGRRDRQAPGADAAGGEHEDAGHREMSRFCCAAISGTTWYLERWRFARHAILSARWEEKPMLDQISNRRELLRIGGLSVLGVRWRRWSLGQARCRSSAATASSSCSKAGPATSIYGIQNRPPRRKSAVRSRRSRPSCPASNWANCSPVLRKSPIGSASSAR